MNYAPTRFYQKLQYNWNSWVRKGNVGTIDNFQLWIHKTSSPNLPPTTVYLHAWRRLSISKRIMYSPMLSVLEEMMVVYWEHYFQSIFQLNRVPQSTSLTWYRGTHHWRTSSAPSRKQSSSDLILPYFPSDEAIISSCFVFLFLTGFINFYVIC